MTYLSNDDGVEIVELLSDADDNNGGDAHVGDDDIIVDILQGTRTSERRTAATTKDEPIELDDEHPPSGSDHENDNENEEVIESFGENPDKASDENDQRHHKAYEESHDKDGSRTMISSREAGIQQPSSDNSSNAWDEINEDADDPRHVTGIDGTGLWRSWKRNFKTSLMAVMDLVDNALDASIPKVGEKNQSFIGRVHVFPDVYLTSTTGLCMVNNSTQKMRPLVDVLRVYDSSKIDSGAGDIGENGVGLKQGCASLSDLSFILSKNGGNDEIGLGIIAKSLQKKEGCYLPAFKFSNMRENGETTLSNQMHTAFSQPKHRDSAACIARYGGANSKDAHNLDVGIDRLCRHFDRLCYNFYNNPYVFLVVLDKVTHIVQRHSDEEMDVYEEDVEENVRVVELLDELKRDIPFMYLHIPDNFDFCINGESVWFKYWTERLVEFSTFAVRVGKTRSWKETITDGDPNAYELNVLVGFDRIRVSSKFLRNEASLYIYSRQSGRLIKYEPDCRHELSLQTGGTDFCSGLTVIVDDIRGHLPLNPTKQDIAFGEESFGRVHKENLFKWVGAVAHFYYYYHLAKFRMKKDLTNAIKKLGKSKCPQPLKSCDDAILSTFKNVVFKNYRGSIRANHQIKSSCHVGHDTYFCLEAPETIPTRIARKCKQTDRLVDHEPIAKRSMMERSISKCIAKSSKKMDTDDLSFESSIAEPQQSLLHSPKEKAAVMKTSQTSPSLLEGSAVAQNNGNSFFHDTNHGFLDEDYDGNCLFQTNDKIGGSNSQTSKIINKSVTASVGDIPYRHRMVASSYKSPSTSTSLPKSLSQQNETFDISESLGNKQCHNRNDYKFMYEELKKKFKESKCEVENLKKKLDEERKSHALTKQQAKRIIEVIKQK